MYAKQPDSEENNPYLQAVLKELRSIKYRDVLKPMDKVRAALAIDEAKEACLRALERLGQYGDDILREGRRMRPGYEVIYDPETNEMLCSFYMDVPYVEARVTLHRQPGQTKEEFEGFVDGIIADVNLDFSEY